MTQCQVALLMSSARVINRVGRLVLNDRRIKFAELASECGISNFRNAKIICQMGSQKPGPEVIKLEYSLKLKIKHTDWLLADTRQAASHCAFLSLRMNSSSIASGPEHSKSSAMAGVKSRTSCEVYNTNPEVSHSSCKRRLNMASPLDPYIKTSPCNVCTLAQPTLEISDPTVSRQGNGHGVLGTPKDYIDRLQAWWYFNYRRIICLKEKRRAKLIRLTW